MSRPTDRTELASLVSEAKSARGRPPSSSASSMADDASISSFTRSVARVARAAETNDARSAASAGSRGSSRRSHSTGRNSGGSRRSGESNATDRLRSLVAELSQEKAASNRPAGGRAPADPSVGSHASGYLPSQYSRGRDGESSRSAMSNTSRSRETRGGYSRASSRGSSMNSGSAEPTGFVMPSSGPSPPPGGPPPQYSPQGTYDSQQGSYASGAIPGSATNSMYGGQGVASQGNNGTLPSLYSQNLGGESMPGSVGGSMPGSTASRTSAGQSTMPTEYNQMYGGAVGMAAAGMGGNGGGGSQGSHGSRGGPYDSFASHSRGAPSSSASAPGGSHGSFTGPAGSVADSFVSQPLAPGAGYAGSVPAMMNNGMHGMQGGMQGSVVSGGTPPGSAYPQSYVGGQMGSQFAGSQMGGGQGYQMVPGPRRDDLSSFASSKGTRSLANSNAIIPRAKFSWASDSVGTQSTVLTRRSLNSASVPEPQQPTARGNKVVQGRLWASFAWIITFMIPNKCIMRPTKDAKQAWREKVALFVIMVSCSVFFVGVFGFVPLLLCKEDTIFSMQDIWLQTGESWVVVHGIIYDVKDLIYRHPGGVKGIVDFLGKDGSKVFPRAPPITLPEKCLDMEKVDAYDLDVYTPENNFTNPTCDHFTDLDVLLGITCHTFAAGSNGTAKFLGDYERGLLSHTTVGLNAEGIDWFALYDRVYDVTAYKKRIDENRDPNADEEEETLENNPAAYLTPTLNKVIMNSLGGDATDLYEALFGSSEYIACLEEMFYTGILDDEFDTFCYTLNIMMYCMLVFVATLMVIQFFASMIYICPRNRTYTEEDVMSPVMVMVPCYNEGDNELRKTIKSVLNTTYPDENKVLFMVADGLVTGNGEDMSTPEHLANILGFDIDEFEDDTFEYDCIGVVHTKNRARVYHGILQKGHKFLKYIAVVKCGLPEEATTSAKPGNRGKRDSQLVIMGYYNRIHYGRELTELDSAIQRAMVDLNLQADMVRFLMAIDADTRVETMSITHMVYGMDKKEKVLALCGETKVDNKASSWVTMIQVFEYYNSHHLKKAFEAAFGCVTCLPGCFTMYRIIADDGSPLLPGDGVLYEYSRNDIETLHEKNLYHLGEDRMLTTLLLKYYPDRSLTFIPEATCWTIVPHTFRILLSQRRRWINSTVHNMFELLKVNTMCGVCCVSMKVVVFIDLIATMILPASYVYAMYLLFLVFFEDMPVSTVLLILYGIIMGVQIIVFILRSRWEYLWWFFIYFTIGLPVFYLILPTYAFWNMDDFSWGKTRSVGGSAAVNLEANAGDDEDSDSDSDDDEYSKQSRGGYNNLGEDGASVPSAVRDAMHRGSREESDSDESESDESDSDDSGDSGSEYSESQAESEYFSQASRLQERM